MGGGLHQGLMRPRKARDPVMQTRETAGQAHREEQIVGAARVVELGGQLRHGGERRKRAGLARLEMRDHGEGHLLVVPRRADGAVAADLEEVSVQGDHLPVQPVKGAEPEIPVLAQHAHADDPPNSPSTSAPGVETWNSVPWSTCSASARARETRWSMPSPLCATCLCSASHRDWEISQVSFGMWGPAPECVPMRMHQIRNALSTIIQRVIHRGSRA